MGNFQIIIMAGGNYKDFEKHKALSFIRGEILIERTIRLLEERGIKNWFISTNNPDFNKYGNIYITRIVMNVLMEKHLAIGWMLIILQINLQYIYMAMFIIQIQL